MKKTSEIFLILALAFLAIILWSCSGSTSADSDYSEAFKVNLLEHTGDTGDVIKNSYGVVIDTLNLYYGAYNTFYEMENTGIDAYHEGNWIYLPWQHITDIETVSLEVFRFSYSDYQNQEEYAERIDYLSFNNYYYDYYLDKFTNSNSNQTNETWFYYIKTTNASGDTAYSDTVGYHLEEKPLLAQPYNGENFVSSDSLAFSWLENSTSSSIRYRLLLFDEEYHLIWQYSQLSAEEPSVIFSDYNDAELNSGLYIWRVDAISEITNNIEINGSTIPVSSGAEALERIFYID